MVITLEQQGYRFLLSEDGHHADWIHPLELATRPGWTDCTQLNDEQLQLLIAERQNASARLVGVTLH
jgi:hypothetical protein